MNKKNASYTIHHYEMYRANISCVIYNIDS